jgi:hypothetical protein
MIIEFLKNIRVKTRKYWLLINVVLIFSVVVLTLMNISQIFSLLLVFIVYTVGFNAIINRKEIVKLLFYFWIVLSLLIFISSLREMKIFSFEAMSKALYNFVIVDTVVVVFLGIAILLFGIIPVFLLNFLDKKRNRVLYDINQAVFYIYRHLDEEVLKKTAKEEIKNLVRLLCEKYELSKNIIVDEEIAKEFNDLTSEEIQKILDLEKEYMKIMRIKNRKLENKKFIGNLN